MYFSTTVHGYLALALTLALTLFLFLSPCQKHHTVPFLIAPIGNGGRRKRNGDLHAPLRNGLARLFTRSVCPRPPPCFCLSVCLLCMCLVLGLDHQDLQIMS